MIKYDLNPFNLILEVTNQLYPEHNARISFVPEDAFKEMLKEYKSPEKDACGFTLFDDEGKTPLIIINAEIPCWASVEIISHEIAHVVAGIEADHGEKWEAEFNKIHSEYLKAFENKMEAISEDE